MNAPKNPHLLDAKAAMVYTRIAIEKGWDESVVKVLATWAFHWGALALEAGGTPR